jgi:hypothetical protein
VRPRHGRGGPGPGSGRQRDCQHQQATGFKNLTIRDGVARVWLTGRVASGGSTFTVASEIMPTLKQFPSVRWVKIYDQNGRTERPFGHSDSIPFSLEP